MDGLARANEGVRPNGDPSTFFVRRRFGTALPTAPWHGDVGKRRTAASLTPLQRR